MTPKQIIEAWMGVKELTGLVLPYSKARALAALKKKLQSEVDVIAEHEKSLAESMGGKPDGPNDYIFPDQDIKKKFLFEVRRMHEENDETLTLPPLDLSEHTAQLRISAAAIEALENIVQFEHDSEEAKG